MLLVVLCTLLSLMAGWWAQQEREKERDKLRQQSIELQSQLDVLEKQVKSR